MKITKDSVIADIIDAVPESLEIMMDEGLHCVGCGGASFETLEEGMLGHGFSQEQLEEMITKINAVNGAVEEVKEPVESDFQVEEIEEGNKTYRRLAGMMFSQKAYDALHELGEGKNTFQIRVDVGGCSGYSYKYDYVEEAQEDEKTYELSKDLKIFMNDFTFNKLHGSIVDFQSGLHGSGLKFVNPNEKSSCHCGSSIGF